MRRAAWAQVRALDPALLSTTQRCRNALSPTNAPSTTQALVRTHAPPPSTSGRASGAARVTVALTKTCRRRRSLSLLPRRRAPTRRRPPRRSRCPQMSAQIFVDSWLRSPTRTRAASKSRRRSTLKRASCSSAAPRTSSARRSTFSVSPSKVRVTSPKPFARSTGFADQLNDA